MINDLKLGIKLLKYSSQLTMSVVTGILFFIIGVAGTLFLSDNMMFSGLFILLGAMWPVQLLYSINVSNQVQSSSSKKKLQTTVPAIMYTGCELILYTFFLILELMLAHSHPERLEMLPLKILFTGIVAFFMAIYTGTAFKYFFVSLLVFMGSYLGFSIFSTFIKYNKVASPFSLGVVILLGYALVITGCIVQYLLYLLFYKRNLSKYAQGSAMRKCM